MAKKDDKAAEQEQTKPLTTEEAMEAGQAEQERINEQQEAEAAAGNPTWPAEPDPNEPIPSNAPANPPQPNEPLPEEDEDTE
jgi:hypothetical protein